MKRTLEEKQELIATMDKMLAEGSSVKESSKRLGLAHATDHSRFRREISRNGHNGAVPVRDIKKVNNATEKMLRAENLRLRTLVVDLSLDVQALKEYHAQ